MEYVGIIIALLSAGLFLFGIGYVFFKCIAYFFGGTYAIKLKFKKLTPNQLRIIEHHSDYYQKLPPQSQALFRKKALYFLHGHNFIPKKNIVITDEVKMYICAAAAQITFGLPLLKLPRFRDILVFPSKYYNKTTKHHHVGEVNTGGAIVLSWEHIVKGFANPHDGFNVALHELAHALRLEDYYPNEEHDFLEQEDINYMHYLFGKMKKQSQRGQKMFIRNYAFSNLEEFFAVSVEYFFEQPRELRSEMPQLYQCIANILRQDTAYLEELHWRKNHS